MKRLADNSVDSVVTDPPYGISFLGKKWDYDVPSVEVWVEALRVLKPGGHALIACGTRTQHRMVVSIEDAGFQVRDVISWVYATGFPKSLNIGKEIDKRGGKDIAWFGRWLREWRKENNVSSVKVAKLFPSKSGKITGCVRNWELGRSLPTVEQFNTIKNAFDLPFETIEEAERVVVGKRKNSSSANHFKPGADHTKRVDVDITAASTEEAVKWEGWGTGLKPACEFFTLVRKPFDRENSASNVLAWGTGALNIEGCKIRDGEEVRHPTNLIHDGSTHVLMGLRGASHFFFCAKASKAERNAGLAGIKPKNNMRVNAPRKNEQQKTATKVRNNHPTVKPLALMEYLCRLITPPGGTVLDPYMGSGTTGVACVKEGFDFVGIELDEGYFNIAEKRIGAQ
jgi:DNA modification methylase